MSLGVLRFRQAARSVTPGPASGRAFQILEFFSPGKLSGFGGEEFARLISLLRVYPWLSECREYLFLDIDQCLHSL